MKCIKRENQHSYNDGVYITKGDSLSMLMTILLPMNFQLKLLFTLHVCPLDFHIIINLNTIYMVYYSDVSHGNS